MSGLEPGNSPDASLFFMRPLLRRINRTSSKLRPFDSRPASQNRRQRTATLSWLSSIESSLFIYLENRLDIVYHVVHWCLDRENISPRHGLLVVLFLSDCEV